MGKATKKFIIEVEEGVTDCKFCPFTRSETCSEIRELINHINCNQYNLATMKITEYDDHDGKALLYAVEKTAERTKREVINKAVEWLGNNMFHSVNNGVQINGVCISDFAEKFKQAMD